MFIKLDREVIELLRCPFCKAALDVGTERFACSGCGTAFPKRRVNVGSHEEGAYDFRLDYPPGSATPSARIWNDGQTEYEEWSREQAARDDLETYLAEIEGVREIYTEEFVLHGSILDVGGHQGRLRHFLRGGKAHLYVSVDPYLNVFEKIEDQRHLLQVYPCLSEPCNFLAGRAEALPFASSVFDWVHMRSVLDHFEDPFMALKEAYRVLKPGGRLLIGLAIMEERGGKPRRLYGACKRALSREGAGGVLRIVREAAGHAWQKAIGRSHDHHMYRFTRAGLKGVLGAARLDVDKEHWQKPPLEFCLYLSASARKAVELAGRRDQERNQNPQSRRAS